MAHHNTDLFDLIKSLDKNERRYFKLFVQSLGGKSANYIKLFDAIARQKEYNEVKVKRKFRGEKFIQSLSLYKQYLHDAILKSLRNYHADKRVDDTILDGIRNFKILLNKGLYPLLIKEINRIEKLAKDYQRDYYLPSILFWKYSMGVVTFGNKNIKNIEELEEELSELTASVNYLGDCMNQLKSLVKSKFFHRTTGNVLEEVTLLKPRSEGLMENTLYYNRVINYWALKHDWKNALKGLMELLELMELNKEVLNDIEWKNSYLAGLSSGMDISSSAPFVEDFYLLQEKLNKIDKSSIQSRTYLHIYNSRLRFNRNIGNLVDAKDCFEEFKEYIVLNPNSKSHHVIPFLYLEIGHIFYINNEFDEALDFYRISLDICKERKVYRDLNFTLRILEIMVFYEKEEWLLLPSLIQSLNKKISKEDDFYSIAKPLFDLFKNLNKQVNDKAQQVDSFMVAKNELLSVDKHSKLLDYFPYVLWIDSKLEKVCFEKVLQQR